MAVKKNNRVYHNKFDHNIITGKAKIFFKIDKLIIWFNKMLMIMPSEEI